MEFIGEVRFFNHSDSSWKESAYMERRKSCGIAFCGPCLLRWPQKSCGEIWEEDAPLPEWGAASRQRRVSFLLKLELRPWPAEQRLFEGHHLPGRRASLDPEG